MVTRILSLCVCLALVCAVAGVGIAQAANSCAPYGGPPLKVPVSGPPQPLFVPGPPMAGPGQMCGVPSCPPPCPPPFCAPPGCPPPDCGGSSWLNGFNPLCGLLSVVTAPFRFLANCVNGDKSCQPLPPPCAPICMPECPPPCPAPISKCKPQGMPRAAYGYAPPMMMGR
jgi:hypothetical protein